MDISQEIRGLLERLSAALAEHDGLLAPGPTHLFAAHHQISETARRELDTMIAHRQPAPPALVIADDLTPSADDAEVAPETVSTPKAAEAEVVEKPNAPKKQKPAEGDMPAESSSEDASDEER